MLIVTPYRTDKNLGRAYNEAFEGLPDDKWVCLMDYDTMFLTPDAINILHGYVERFPNAGVLTCLTNRIGQRSRHQLLNGVISDNDSISHHISLAEKQKEKLYQVEKIDDDFSGMLMLIKVSTWKKVKFDEDGLCLGVDTNFGRRVRAAGFEILCMQGLYIWHTYRLKNGIKDKSHLIEHNPVINILIRASREEQLYQCLRSINNQTYKNIKVICSVDREMTIYDAGDIPMFDVINVTPGPGSHPWNDYCNNLKKQVKEGWFMFLDDDDELLNPYTIEQAVKYLTEPNRAVVFQMIRDGVKIPSDAEIRLKVIQRGSIGMPCIFLHHSQKDIAFFDSEKAADYRFVKAVSRKLKVKFIPHTIVKVNGENHGQKISVCQTVN